MKASAQPQVFLDLRYESPPQFFAPTVHRQLAGAVATSYGEMPASALVCMKGAPLFSQPATKLSCIHSLKVYATLVLMSTFVLSNLWFMRRAKDITQPAIIYGNGHQLG